MAQSFWPDFQVARPAGWVRPVLDEAGRELREKTGGLVGLRVTPYQTDDPTYPFAYECQLVVPEHDFLFLLFRVKTTDTGTQAVIVSPVADPNPLTGEVAFRDALARALHAERTQLIVQNLLSMAAA